MAGEVPEETVRRAAVRQSWRQVAFAHWRVHPGAIEGLLPPGLRADLVDGSAWVSIVAFRIEGFRVLGAPAVGYRSAFPETNLRTYVRTSSGRDGLWFLSLDVPSAFNVAGGRLIGVPYHRAAMSVATEPGGVRYRCRRLTGRAGHDILVRPRPGPVGPDEAALAAVLAGRWRAFSRVAGGLLEVAVEHQPWPLQPAGLVELDETLFAAAGLPRPDQPPLVHFAEGVDARLAPAAFHRSR